MEGDTKQEDVKQLCTMTINVIVESDEQAIEYKKRMSTVFADNPEVQINFGLQNAPRPR
ncbi:hypothetical protein LCGC14_1614640 [marine sediment metagenome]|uniref:Uncharacterized protein n=1 Tax=marine sediment metagenome TaxID=412755 RepID=A0A0F9IU14_9ZZZZ